MVPAITIAFEGEIVEKIMKRKIKMIVGEEIKTVEKHEGITIYDENFKCYAKVVDKDIIFPEEGRVRITIEHTMKPENNSRLITSIDEPTMYYTRIEKEKPIEKIASFIGLWEKNTGFIMHEELLEPCQFRVNDYIKVKIEGV